MSKSYDGQQLQGTPFPEFHTVLYSANLGVCQRHLKASCVEDVCQSSLHNFYVTTFAQRLRVKPKTNKLCHYSKKHGVHGIRGNTTDNVAKVNTCTARLYVN